MKFLCLVYFKPETLAAMTPAERAVLTRDSLAYNDLLRQKNHYIAAEALEPVQYARTVRVRHGQSSVTDGPYSETKEVVGGFILIHAATFDEALQVAAGIPLAKLGSIEVRPIMQMSV